MGIESSRGGPPEGGGSWDYTDTQLADYHQTADVPKRAHRSGMKTTNGFQKRRAYAIVLFVLFV